MIDIQSVGHVCVDLTPELFAAPDTTPGVLSEVGPVAIRIGGAVGNTVRTITALGRTAAAAVMIGRDQLGDLCEHALEASLPGMVVVQRSESKATSYSVVVSPPEGDRSFWHHTGANDDFDGTCELLGAKYVHFGYPTLVPGMTVDAGRPTVELFKRARAQGSATSLDLAYCAANSLLKNYDWPGYFAEVLPHTDVFCPSWEDITSAMEDVGDAAEDVEAGAAEFVRMGAAVVLITLGDKGSYLATGAVAAVSHLCAAVGADPELWANRRVWIEPAPVERMVSTNAAGDTFKAAFLLATLEMGDPVSAAQEAARVVSRHIAGLPLKSDA